MSYDSKEHAIHGFWSSFGIDAFYEGSVPDLTEVMEDSDGHIITYNVSTGEFQQTTPLYASLWYKDFSWAEITAKANEIYDYIGYGGRLIPYTGGYMWVTRGSPFSQRITDEDDTIRRIYININVEFLSA